MTRGNAKSERWAIVINPPKSQERKEILEGYLLKVINHYQSFLAGIIHDKDQDNGKAKTIHCHCFLTTKSQTKRELLNDLKELLDVKEEQISIDATNSDILYCQYLIHANDTEKHQYNRKEIITNNREELDRRLDEQYKSPEDKEAELIEALSTKDLKEILRNYGLEVGRRYLPLFKQLQDETKRQQAYNTLNASYERLERRFNRLYELAHKLILRCGNGLLDTQKKLIAYDATLQAIEDLANDQLDADLEEISD